MSSFKIIQIQQKKVCLLKFYAPDNFFFIFWTRKKWHINQSRFWVRNVFRCVCTKLANFVRLAKILWCLCIYIFFTSCWYFSYDIWHMKYPFSFFVSFSIQYPITGKISRASTIELFEKIRFTRNRAHVLTAQTFTSPLTRNA